MDTTKLSLTRLNRRYLPFVFASGWLISGTLLSPLAPAQESLHSGKVQPMGEWLGFKEATFRDRPILLHLQTGYERAVLMPEAIRLENPDQQLPGCEIYIDTDVIAFYPTNGFRRQPVRLIGEETGTVYELRVRASAEGMREPIQVLREAS